MAARIFKISLDKKYKKQFDNVVVKKLEEKFSKKDISFKAQNGHLVSKLHNIDLELFQKTIKILERENSFLKNKNPLNILIKQIENIGSYGIMMHIVL